MCIQGQLFSVLEEEEYAVKTRYGNFFERKSSSPTLTVLRKRAALLIPTGTWWKPLSHTEAWYTSSLTTKCQDGNILFGCKTTVSATPLPLSADLSGSLDLSVMGIGEPNPSQCNAVTASLQGFCRSSSAMSCSATALTLEPAVLLHDIQLLAKLNETL